LDTRKIIFCLDLRGAKVFLKAIRSQFLHDLKASWQKSALLGILLVLGLFFWIPPLVRAMSGSFETSSPESRTSNSNSVAVPVPLEKASQPPGPTAHSITWEKADDLLATDPLVQSAEIASVRGNPFEVATDQFSPPILFGEDEPAGVPKSKSAPQVARGTTRDPAATAAAKPVIPRGPSGLTLKSTILGEKRRAALINETLYSEGSVVQVDGEDYLLAAVRSRQVELKKGDQVFVLDLPHMSASEGIRIERVGSPEPRP
jgi:hypothetical protein